MVSQAIEGFTYQLEGPIGLDLKPVKRALKTLGDENGPRVLGCLQGPFAPALGPGPSS